MFEGFTAAGIATDDAVIHTLHGGSGPPLLLLHGYPQTHIMWHKVAPRLAESFTVVVPDLRGYGDSTKPPGDDTHAAYSKRAMAKDQVEVMEALGFESFFVAGHDRGGRVGHRLAPDHPERGSKLSVLDIVPTHKVFSTIDQTMATGYYHWFFLIQPFDLPETLIGSNPEFYLRKKLGSWGADVDSFSPEAMAEYVRCFSNPETIHATCEDYRAAASIDLEHDEADMGEKIACPVRVLWGAKGLMERRYDVLATWRERAIDADGRALPCGHFLPEEAPDETYAELARFFG